MTLKTATTKTLAATTIAAAAVVGTSTLATAAETSTAAGGASVAEAGGAAGQTATANPSAEVKFDSIGDFLHHYEGKSLANSKGGYQGECVSLISRVLEEVHGVDHGAWGNAVDYQKGSIGGQQMAENGFNWNTDHNFKNGDILVWGDGAQTSGFGHIGIYYEGQVWQQNFNGDRNLHTYDGTIDAYLGYWRA